MTNVIALSNLKSMRAAQQNLRQTTSQGAGAFGGRQLLKLEKGSGDWVFGQEAEELDGATIAVMPTSFQHGIVAWAPPPQSKLEGEAMCSVSSPAPRSEEQPEPDLDWRPQASFLAAIVTGKHKGTQLIFKSSALGGREFIEAVFNAICDQVDIDARTPVPVLELSSTWYKHKSYGKTYKPTFEVASWQAMDDSEPTPQVSQVEQVEPQTTTAEQYAEASRGEEPDAVNAAAEPTSAPRPRTRVRTR